MTVRFKKKCWACKGMFTFNHTVVFRQRRTEEDRLPVFTAEPNR